MESRKRSAADYIVDKRQNWLKSVSTWASKLRGWWMRGGGNREIARRRRQIERGQLTASNGLVREDTQ